MRLLPTFCFAALLLLPAVGGTSDIDPLSAACLGCHDGTSAAHVRYCFLGEKDTGCGGHIIGASYAEMAAKDPSLLPQSELPPEIALYEGRITCVTCHGSDPHLGERLAIDNRDSALCRGCHLK